MVSCGTIKKAIQLKTLKVKIMDAEAIKEILGDLDGIWLVKHPVSKYYEETQREVKRMARRANVKIMDAKFAGNIADELLAKNPPKLTEKGAEKKKPAPKKKAPAKAEESGNEEGGEE